MGGSCWRTCYEHPATRAIPIVVCSVIREEELALELGAAVYVPKPVRRGDLLAALDRAWRPPAIHRFRSVAVSFSPYAVLSNSRRIAEGGLQQLQQGQTTLRRGEHRLAPHLLLGPILGRDHEDRDIPSSASCCFCASTCQPSIPGSTTSSKTRSGRAVRIASNPSTPSAAVVISERAARLIAVRRRRQHADQELPHIHLVIHHQNALHRLAHRSDRLPQPPRVTGRTR